MEKVLQQYFEKLIERVENSEISNQGKDENGFFLPFRAVLLQRLNLLKDLHASPRAGPMLKSAWAYVVENLPPEWLIMTEEEKVLVKKMLS